MFLFPLHPYLIFKLPDSMKLSYIIIMVCSFITFTCVPTVTRDPHNIPGRSVMKELMIAEIAKVLED